MAVTPLHAEIPASNRARRTQFEKALARYKFALDRVRNEPDGSDEMSELLTDALMRAEDAVMSEPAANLDELRIKADILWDDVAAQPSEAGIKLFFADLIRLSGGGASRLFDPTYWLERFEHLGGGWAVAGGKAHLLVLQAKDPIADWLAELDMRGGRSAVEALILARHASLEAQEA